MGLICNQNTCDGHLKLKRNKPKQTNKQTNKQIINNNMYTNITSQKKGPFRVRGVDPLV